MNMIYQGWKAMWSYRANILFLALSVIYPSSIGLAAGEEEQAKLIEGAKREGKLTLYGSMTVDDSAKLLNRFKELYPFLETEHVRASGTRLLNRVLSESASKKLGADVVQATSLIIHPLKKRGLLQKYLSPERDVYSGGQKDPDGFWTNVYINTNVIAYNTRMVSPKEAPQTYNDLLNPNWKMRMGMDSDDSGWFANILKFMGETQGLAFMKKLSLQSPQMRKGHALNSTLLAAGEFPIAVNVYGHEVEKLKGQGAPIEWARAHPIIAILHPVAITAHAPHPNAAKLFANFMLSKEGQWMIRSFRRIPARPDVYPDPPRLVEGLDLVPEDFSVFDNLNIYVRQFDEIFLKQPK